MGHAAKSPISRRLKLATAAGLTVANGVALRAGLRRPVDGWRRGAGLLLRAEESTFYLSAFGLDTWSDAPDSANLSIADGERHVTQRLAAFFAGEPDAHVAIHRFPLEDRHARHPGPCYSLAFEPWVDGPGRFLRPDHWPSQDVETSSSSLAQRAVLLRVVCRVSSNGAADVWARANHVGIDGVPLQDLLTRLEESWGTRLPTVFCSSDDFAPFRRPRDCGGDNGIAEIQDFVDFSPLLAWRSTENQKLPEPMTFSAAFIWILARHPAFADLYVGSTVEIPVIGEFGRGVGVVTVRPADYFSRRDGLAAYVRDFNAAINLTRQRKSRGCKILDAAAHVPPSLARELLGSAIEHGGSAFGSLGLTVLRQARVFGAPMGDPPHANGFIAIGSVSLDTGNGKRVGSVTIKGPPEKISAYPTFIREVIQCSGVAT
jgi:hypothetical protein